MQLGVRWRYGEVPHRSVPAALHGPIARTEAEYAAQRVDATAWTLTWLEGRARCILGPLDGQDDVLVTEHEAEEDDEWLN